MSPTYKFLKQCGTFFVSTVNGDFPAVRPFGAVMEYDDELYISTSNTKNVYAQLIANPNIQIAAVKEAREWIRISGKAVEVHDFDIKQAMLDACPVLLRHFDSNKSTNFAIFKISEMESSI